MTTPVIAATGLTSNANAAPQTINLPASIAAGDLLLLFIQLSNTSLTFTTPVGWTSLLSDIAGTAVFYKYASGAEGATVSFSYTNIARSIAAVCYRITGSDGVTAPAIATLAEVGGGISSYDPPSLSPSWGSATTLWLAVAANDTGRTASSGPASYSLQNNQADPTPAAELHIYTRANTIATENPSAITLSGSANGYAITVGVKPASAYFFNQPMLGM